MPNNNDPSASVCVESNGKAHITKLWRGELSAKTADTFLRDAEIVAHENKEYPNASGGQSGMIISDDDKGVRYAVPKAEACGMPAPKP